MLTNKLFITDDTIQFLGFDLLEQNITFCLYPGGIVILPEWKKEKRPHYYESVLDSERKIHDKLLINILKNRGLAKEEGFVCHNNSYTELTPHKART